MSRKRKYSNEFRLKIVACCVGPKFREHKISQAMFAKLFELYPGYSFSLDVLKDNEIAIGAYEKLGFVVENEMLGFALEEKDRPECVHMLKKF